MTMPPQCLANGGPIPWPAKPLAYQVVHGSPDWLAIRRRLITGSDAPVIMGAHPKKQPALLYEEKLATVDGKPDEDPDYLYFGREAEEPVLRRFQALMPGRVVHLHNILYMQKVDGQPGDEPLLMGGDLDGGRVFCDNRGDNIEVLEVKASANRDLWGPDGSTEYSEQAMWQVLHYLAMTGATMGRILAAIAWQELRKYCVPPDPVLIRELLDRERAFAQCLKSKTPPPIDFAGPGALETVRRRHPLEIAKRIRIEDPDILGEIAAWEAAKANKSAWDATATQIRARIEAKMQGAGIAYVEGLQGKVLQNLPSQHAHYEIPEEIKEQYKVMRPTEPQLKLVNEKGR